MNNVCVLTNDNYNMMEVFNEIQTPADPKQGHGFVGKTPVNNLQQKLCLLDADDTEVRRRLRKIKKWATKNL